MPTAVIDCYGRICFLAHPENTDLLTIPSNSRTFRASNIEVFLELKTATKNYIRQNYKHITLNPYDFWVDLGYRDVLGPFTLRSDAVKAEEHELRRRGDA